MGTKRLKRKLTLVSEHAVVQRQLLQQLRVPQFLPAANVHHVIFVEIQIQRGQLILVVIVAVRLPVVEVGEGLRLEV